MVSWLCAEAGNAQLQPVEGRSPEDSADKLVTLIVGPEQFWRLDGTLSRRWHKTNSQGVLCMHKQSIRHRDVPCATSGRTVAAVTAAIAGEFFVCGLGLLRDNCSSTKKGTTQVCQCYAVASYVAVTGAATMRQLVSDIAWSHHPGSDR